MATPAITHGFAGQWLTTFGWMTLEQRGASITGVYHYGNTEGRLEGSVEGGDGNLMLFRFRYQEPNEAGEGVFRLLRAGKFTGTYNVAGDARVRRWEGERGWDGIWDMRVFRGDFGWSLEISIPFRTLVFDPKAPAWGINFQRTVKRKNEDSLWSGWGRNENLRRMTKIGRAHV